MVNQFDLEAKIVPLIPLAGQRSKCGSLRAGAWNLSGPTDHEKREDVVMG